MDFAGILSCESTLAIFLSDLFTGYASSQTQDSAELVLLMEITIQLYHLGVLRTRDVRI